MPNHDAASSPDAREALTKALLARWQQQDDRAALDELLAMEIAELKVRIRARSSNKPDPAASVSDVAQEAVLRLLNAEPAPKFEHPRALRAYLWTTAWRLLTDRLRAAQRPVARVDSSRSEWLDEQFEGSGGASELERRDLASALEVMINLLDSSEQEILSLVYMRELGIPGAARQLGITEDAANMRAVRARRSLARKLLRWTELIG